MAAHSPIHRAPLARTRKFIEDFIENSPEDEVAFSPRLSQHGSEMDPMRLSSDSIHHFP
jgi:hypothetical protein